MSIILPLFTIPLEIFCIYFLSTHLRQFNIHIHTQMYIYAPRRPNASYLLVISKNMLIYVSNNSFVLFFALSISHLFACLLVLFSHSCSASLSFLFISFHFFDHLSDCLAQAHTIRAHRAFILYDIFRLHDESIHT